jgi:hypothetical protein
MNYEPFTSIENLTLAHFSHFWLTLHSLAPLHLSRTLYKSTHFMQNKPNLLDAQMNVSSILTTACENISDWTLGQNKPNLVRPALFAKELPD